VQPVIPTASVANEGSAGLATHRFDRS
jgi:hypothetical protein